MIQRYISILQRHKHPVRFVLARLLALSGLCRYITIPQKGYCIRFHPANLPTHIWIDPQCREEPLVFFNAYLQKGDVVIDVGANIGDTVLTSSLRVGQLGSVTGIEAHPRTFRYLQENIRLNDFTNITLVHSAVGDEIGTVNFSDSRYDDMNQVNRGTLEVPLNRLDELVSTIEPIALLKVDVEGYERFVFRGATRLLTQAVCIYFEVGEKMCRDFGYEASELLDEVSGEGFQLFIHEKGTTLIPLKYDQSFDHYRNVVGCRDVANLIKRTGWTLGT